MMGEWIEYVDRQADYGRGGIPESRYDYIQGRQTMCVCSGYPVSQEHLGYLGKREKQVDLQKYQEKKGKD